MTDKEKSIENVLSRNVEEIVDKKHLGEALRGGKKLRVKHGIDPTGDKIHIGRAVALWKLREFQDLGHKIVLIIGDFTAQIGDPSDKLSKRPFLTKEQINKNLKNYLPQIGKIIDVKKAEVRYNSEWLSKLNFRETAELAESFSVNQMLRRRAFQDRFKKGDDISLREFLYPIMQGYDSVAVKADVEIGGEDQLFNLLAGREVQKHYGQKQQDVLTVKMLIGTDGRKMSTSWGNVINITDSPDEQFGKIMSLRDDLVTDYFGSVTRLDSAEIKAAKRSNPRDTKIILGKEAVSLYHGNAAAEKAAGKWESIFSKKEIPKDIRIISISSDIVSSGTIANLIAKSKIVDSNSEAWRLIKQGAVEKDGKVIKDPKSKITKDDDGKVLKIGKKNFLRMKK